MFNYCVVKYQLGNSKEQTIEVFTISFNLTDIELDGELCEIEVFGRLVGWQRRLFDINISK